MCRIGDLKFILKPPLALFTFQFVGVFPIIMNVNEEFFNILMLFEKRDENTYSSNFHGLVRRYPCYTRALVHLPVFLRTMTTAWRRIPLCAFIKSFGCKARANSQFAYCESRIIILQSNAGFRGGT